MLLSMKTVVVDQDDNLLGVKDDKEITRNDIYRVTGLWLTNSNDQVLIAQRKLTKKNDPGKWGPAVSGTIEEGETYQTNVYKEAEEEIGLTNHTFKLGPKIFNDDRYRYFVQWFTCQTDWPLDKFKPQASEVEQIAWVDRKTLLNDVVKNQNKYIDTAYRFVELFDD